LTHREKPVTNFALFTFNLYRCIQDLASLLSSFPQVGRCKLNAVVDPQLESAWFQPLTYEVKTWFQNVPFKCNLHRCAQAKALFVAFCKRTVGLHQVESS
jgi:hypothetical protein